MRIFKEIWNSKDIRNRVLFTLFILVVYRFISHITVPNVNTQVLAHIFQNNASLGVFSALMGGGMRNFSIILMGVSPYINASIMIQLLTVVVPKLENLSKEGEQGRKIINRYTRWLTLPIAFVQSYGMILLLNNLGAGDMPIIEGLNNPAILLPTMLAVTAGTIILVWLGELITEYGIGNGVSIIIFAGIVATIPQAIGETFAFAGLEQEKMVSFVILIIITILLTIFIIWFTEAQRNIPITYASRGVKISGDNANIPIRVNQAGMIPIIFSVSLIMFPSIIANLFSNSSIVVLQNLSEWILRVLSPHNPNFIYIMLYFIFTFFFTYFYVSVTFKPNDIAENLQKRGGFIPGIRPGTETAKFIAKVSSCLTLWGGLFLSLVAISPYIIEFLIEGIGTGAVPMLMTGAGLIIVVGVVLDIVRTVNMELVMHDYDKFY